jgi:hypothetical protein
MPKTKHCVELEIYSPSPLLQSDEAGEFFDIYCRSLPGFLPERLNWCEPLKYRFNANQPKSNAIHWKGGIIARRARSWFMVTGRVNPIYSTHSTIHVTLCSDVDEILRLVEFFRDVHERFQIDFGCALVFGAPHVKLGLSNRTVNTTKGKPDRFVIPRHLFYRYTPDLYWLTIFGAPYTRAMGAECFLNAPAFRTELWKDNTVMVQLSGDIWDAVNDPESYESNWLRVKSAINRDIFFRVGKLSGYRLPDWPPVPDQLRKSWDTPPADERLETPQQRERFVNMSRHLMSRGRKSRSKPD